MGQLDESLDQPRLKSFSWLSKWRQIIVENLPFGGETLSHCKPKSSNGLSQSASTQKLIAQVEWQSIL